MERKINVNVTRAELMGILRNRVDVLSCAFNCLVAADSDSSDYFQESLEEVELAIAAMLLEATPDVADASRPQGGR